MENIFFELTRIFSHKNYQAYSQQFAPMGWEVINEIGVADDLSIVEHFVLYKVSKFHGSEIYVFARTAYGNLIDFGWSYEPGVYAHWFK